MEAFAVYHDYGVRATVESLAGFAEFTVIRMTYRMIVGVIQEEVVVITLNKYRKAHQLLQEAEGGSSSTTAVVTAEGPTAGLLKPGQGQGGKDSRSMSVTREITRVVRV